MSLSLCILASGSSGNCSVVRHGADHMLIDCGIGPRVAVGRMRPLGIGLDHISAICLTHLDADHFKSTWVNEIIRRGIFLYCHESRVDDLTQDRNNPLLSRLIRTFGGEAFAPLPGLLCRAVHLPHDEHGSHGFVFEGAASRIGYATDMGRVAEGFIDRFSGLDVLAIESNYDLQMQRESARPWFLKQRIMGGRGHLSNEQAFEAVRQILDRSTTEGRELPRHIVLLHRSRQCNHPALLRELFAGDRRIASRLVLAEQDKPTAWLRAGQGEAEQTQMHFSWQWTADESSRSAEDDQAQTNSPHAPLASRSGRA